MKIDRRAGRISRRKSPSSLIVNHMRNVGDFHEPEESPQWGEFLWNRTLDEYFDSRTGTERASRLLGELSVMKRA